MAHLELAALLVQEHQPAIDFFLRVDDFDVAYARVQAHTVDFLSTQRIEPSGTVAVFLDCEGNRWDLLGPAT